VDFGDIYLTLNFDVVSYFSIFTWRY